MAIAAVGAVAAAGGVFWYGTGVVTGHDPLGNPVTAKGASYGLGASVAGFVMSVVGLVSSAGAAGGGVAAEAPGAGAGGDAGSGLSWPEQSGILRDAAAGKGNFGLGSASSADASVLGDAWVGEDAVLASDGKTLVSADGLRQFRPPTFKPQLGSWQANLEQRMPFTKGWFSNGHLDITDLP